MNNAQLSSACVIMQPITKQEFGTLFGPATMHALGHIAANLSFAAVAISLTHTVKTLEPAFNVALSRLILGTTTPLPVISTLIPIMVSAVHDCKGYSCSCGRCRQSLCDLCVAAAVPHLCADAYACIQAVSALSS